MALATCIPKLHTTSHNLIPYLLLVIINICHCYIIDTPWQLIHRLVKKILRS